MTMDDPFRANSVALAINAVITSQSSHECVVLLLFRKLQGM